MDSNDPKHTAKDFKTKKWNILQWPSQSPHLNLIEYASSQNLRQKDQRLKTAAVKAWQSITKEETQCLVMSMGSRLKAIIACKVLQNNILFIIM